MELTANCKRQQVIMQHVGKKPSATCSHQLLPGDTVCLGNDDALWLLPEKYKHVVKFRDMNNAFGHSATAAASCKRCADDAGISEQSSSKRHSSAFASSNYSNSTSDDKHDSDAEQVEMVCKISSITFLISVLIQLAFFLRISMLDQIFQHLTLIEALDLLAVA